ncbi:ribosomal protein S18-alanine N-acetyltransferase [Thalassomonas viridans]|uniref:[Ribosomal protein bS18]-alanine N-acetyltransferase n=1 Tax=Thalassomonas viridans TaxID=137584 RepID=A0AAE9Z513_9GAMM|nr:ribosomal protein S18-alanine N-acetyltransferase [Thalassomonas viridans]WDE06412.1 ribosomal protein S18-alanine N-acetyltransferase [Thalassomonas viridans]
MTLSFLPVTPDDVDSLMPIENACHSHPWSRQVFASCIGGRYFGYYLLEPGRDRQQQVITGFYIGDHIAGESTLMDICVHPDKQGQGFGKHLLHHYFEQAKSLGAEKALLEVRARNIGAQMLYINNGFSEIGRRTGYYPSAVGYEDAIVMARAL